MKMQNKVVLLVTKTTSDLRIIYPSGLLELYLAEGDTYKWYQVQHFMPQSEMITMLTTQYGYEVIGYL